jgi:hypothetical protein
MTDEKQEPAAPNPPPEKGADQGPEKEADRPDNQVSLNSENSGVEKQEG